jgi:hypothetical protein
MSLGKNGRFPTDFFQTLLENTLNLRRSDARSPVSGADTREHLNGLSDRRRVVRLEIPFFTTLVFFFDYIFIETLYWSVYEPKCGFQYS